MVLYKTFDRMVLSGTQMVLLWHRCKKPLAFVALSKANLKGTKKTAISYT